MRKPSAVGKLIGLFGRNIYTMIGIVLVWRGVWYLLDAVDARLFGGSHWLSAAGGVLLGLLLLYLPDRDLKEIERL